MVEENKIASQNTWWKGKKFIEEDKTYMEWKQSVLKIPRADIILPELLENNVCLIRGPRRSGKSVLLKQIVYSLIESYGNDPKSIAYFNCEELATRSKNELDSLISKLTNRMKHYNNKKYILLDEINFVKDWDIEIKAIQDRGLNNTNFILTGSPAGIKNPELREHKKFFLKPLTFREFVISLSSRDFYKYGDMNFYLRHLFSDQDIQSIEELGRKLKSMHIDLNVSSIQEIEKAYIEISPFILQLTDLFNLYMKTGGLPKAINLYLIQNSEKDAKFIGMENFQEQVVEILINDIGHEELNETIAREVLQAIVKRTSSRSSYGNLTESASVTKDSVIKYTNLFNKMFYLLNIVSYDFLKGQKPKSDRKFYFTDPFIFHSMNKWIYGILPKDYLNNEENVSKLCETITASHLASSAEIPVINPVENFLWFYYNRSGEIDFIYKRPDDFLGIEVKYTR